MPCLFVMSSLTFLIRSETNLFDHNAIKNHHVNLIRSGER
ncbi:hypothetical protein AEST_02660 [Alishewanella aestuarii B11]|uniref:Uncharacterized protein n=1 Tax=Alishewanella aestuarii B11 TaxID=1197174 RepID=J1YFI1_9ALTE|nr:hypothetical protein AEST_02660 [Alishewanella aestuarii B11]